jgi:hypothetical protein
MANAKAKSNSVVTTLWINSILNISVLGIDQPITFDCDLASEANRAQAERHGWTQRLCDRAAKGAVVRAAGMSDAQYEAAKAAVTQSKFNAIKELAEYYMSGDVAWRMAGGGSASEGGLLFEALCEFKPEKTPAQITEFIESRTKEQLAVVRKVPELMSIMNRLRMERAGTVDVEEALGDLDSI